MGESERKRIMGKGRDIELEREKERKKERERERERGGGRLKYYFVKQCKRRRANTRLLKNENGERGGGGYLFHFFWCEEERVGFIFATIENLY